MSLSLHAASNKNAAKLFALVLTALGLLFYLWFVFWFAPALGLSWLFFALMSATIGCMFVAAVVTDSGGRSHRVHAIAAYAMAYLFLPLSFLILAAPRTSSLARMSSEVFA
jgi:hypothetical protein